MFHVSIVTSQWPNQTSLWSSDVFTFKKAGRQGAHAKLQGRMQLLQNWDINILSQTVIWEYLPASDHSFYDLLLHNIRSVSI